MASLEIPNLVFSTVSSLPDSGVGGSRRVIAKSPGIPPYIEDLFENRADFAGSILKADLGERNIYTFSRLEQPELWLFNRAVVLDQYRGGHRFLIHGAVLSPEHLGMLEGNPFLLDDEQIQNDCGFRFLDDHPGTHAELEPFVLEPNIEGLVKELNRQRFAQYSAEYGGENSRFPELFELLLDNNRLAFAVQKPDARFLEWIFLHFHRLDRTAFGFHTWYSHDRPIYAYRLILISSEDIRSTRKYFRDIVVLQASDSRRYPEGVIGNLTNRNRDRSPHLLLAANMMYKLFFLAQGKEIPTVDYRLGSVCLRYTLGETMTCKRKDH